MQRKNQTKSQQKNDIYGKKSYLKAELEQGTKNPTLFHIKTHPLFHNMQKIFAKCDFSQKISPIKISEIDQKKQENTGKHTVKKNEENEETQKTHRMVPFFA